MKLYRIQYSGEAYVLADSEGGAVLTMARKVDDEETGVYVDGAKLVTKLSEVPTDWIDALPFKSHNCGGDSRTIREILSTGNTEGAGQVSLDVSLTGVERTVECRCCDCGHEHTRQSSEELFIRNITHNLTPMADAAGLYEPIWQPEKMGITTARQLVAPLEAGLYLLRADPDKFRRFNPSNGWGTYEGLVEFVAQYLQACKDNPDANVRVER